MPEILQKELPRVQLELGNFWSVTPGSQMLWTTAVNNVLKNARYKDSSDDLKNLMLGRYGEFHFTGRPMRSMRRFRSGLERDSGV